MLLLLSSPLTLPITTTDDNTHTQHSSDFDCDTAAAAAAVHPNNHHTSDKMEQQQQQSNGYQIRQRSKQQQENDDDDSQAQPEKQLSKSADNAKNDVQRKEKKVLNTSTPKKKTSCLKMLLLFLLFLLVLFTAIIPVLFRFSLLIQRGTVFMNIVNFSLRTPEGAGLRCTRNWLLHLKVPFRNNVINNNNNNNKETQSIHLGVWHVSPQEATCENVPETGPGTFSKLNDGRLVVLYTHGMGGTRSSAHRVALYKLLSNKLNAHVLAFDYRGFGDSGPDPEGPRAEGLAQDTEALYRWLVEVEQVHPNKVLLWGHSMGTAVAIRFLSNLSSKAVETGSTSEHLPPPLATVLEAPFTSLREAIPVFPLAKIFSLLPHFNSCFLEPLVGNHHLNFDSSVLMSRVSTPLLFFHAEDDRIVPYSLGRKLYNIALQEQPASVQLRPSFVSFPRERHFGHKNIVAAGDELVRAVQSFLEAARQQSSIN